MKPNFYSNYGHHDIAYKSLVCHLDKKSHFGIYKVSTVIPNPCRLMSESPYLSLLPHIGHCHRDCYKFVVVLGRTKMLFSLAGKVTSLVAKKDLDLASKIEDALRKNESLEAITKESVRRDIARTQNQSTEKGKSKRLVKVSKVMGKSGSRFGSGNNGSGMKSGKGSPVKSMKKGIQVSKSGKSSSANSLRKASTEKRQSSKMVSATKSTNSKLNVVGFRAQNSSSNNKESGL